MFSQKIAAGTFKVGLKLNIQKTEIMASGPITSFQIDGETVENSDRLYFLGLQNHCTVALISHSSKIMLKILQARLQQYMNQELPDV